MNDISYTVPVFPQNDRAGQAWSRIEPKLERLHDEFLSAWRHALSAIIPARVELDFQSMESKPYAQFVKDAAAFSDIHIYEIEALQSLCAWSFDPGFLGAAVDHMFGGTGRAPLVDLPPRRGTSPIEEGVRRRLVESLATAYESVWQTLYPIRLNALRQEALLSSLRLTASSDYVVHARFSAKIQLHNFQFEFCMPLRALEVLESVAGISPTPNSASATSVNRSSEFGMALPLGQVEDAPVHIEAVLGDMDLTVAQLMSLSIGQVLPMRMNDAVALEVDGLCIATGQSGIRAGRHAVKVHVSSESKLPTLGSQFQPLSDALNSESNLALDAEAADGLSAADGLVQTEKPFIANIHEPNQPQ